MQFFQSIESFKNKEEPLCITLGNFDGVHRGHVALLDLLSSQAKTLGAKTMVIFFEPQPMEFFNTEDPPARLYSCDEKISALDGKVDYAVSLKFDEKLQSMSPESFLTELLCAHLNIKSIVVGHDFRFGHKRAGDCDFLNNYSKPCGYKLMVVPPIAEAQERVSSTAIRQALAANDLEKAALLLGRPYSMEGEVEQGQQLGRTIGVPTANINLHRRKAPIKGVFIAEAEISGLKQLPAVVNLGTRPTLDGKKSVLEVHLLDFNKDCYGQRLKVHFLKKIRDEIKFPGIDALKEQIFADIETAKQYFAEVKRDEI